MKNFTQGATVRMKATFKNFAGALVDPSVVEFHVLIESTGEEHTHIYDGLDGVVRVSLGIYYYDQDTTDHSGVFKWRIVGTDAASGAKQGSFYVEPDNTGDESSDLSSSDDSLEFPPGFPPFIDSRDFNIPDDGVTAADTEMQAFLTALEGKTGRLHAPAVNYKLNTVLTRPAGGFSLIADPETYYSGVGHMPGDPANPAQLMTSTWFHRIARGVGPVGIFGDFTLSASFDADLAFDKYGGAFYCSAKLPENSTAFGWAGNSLMEIFAGLLGNAIGWEFDFNNDSANGQGIGILNTGVGSYQPGFGMMTTRADATSPWQVGNYIRDSIIGLLIEPPSYTTPGYALWLRNYTNNMMVLSPSDDTNPSQGLMFWTLADQFTIVGGVTKRGGLIVGPYGNELKQVLSTTATLAIGAVAAGATVRKTVALAHVTTIDDCNANPNIDIADGITWSAHCYVDGMVTIRIYNFTGAPVNADGGSSFWRVSALQYGV